MLQVLASLPPSTSFTCHDLGPFSSHRNAYRIPIHRHISISRFLAATDFLAHSSVQCPRDCHARSISLSDQRRRRHHVIELLRRLGRWLLTVPATAASQDDQQRSEREHHHDNHAHYSSYHKPDCRPTHSDTPAPTTPPKPAFRVPPRQPAGKPAKPPTPTANPPNCPPSNRAQPTSSSRSTTSTNSSNRGRAWWIWATLLGVGVRLRRIGLGRAGELSGSMSSQRCRRGA